MLKFTGQDIIEAGAGCGKTSKLLDRYLMALGFESTGFETYKERPGPRLQVRDIVALTFTEEAAHQMQDRLLRIVRQSLKDSHLEETLLAESQISTFHSYCLRLIQNDMAVLGLQRPQLTMPSIVAQAISQRIKQTLPHFDRASLLFKHFELDDLCHRAIGLWHDSGSSFDATSLRQNLKTQLENYCQALALKLEPVLKAAEDVEVQELLTYLKNPSGARPQFKLNKKPFPALKKSHPELYQSLVQFKDLFDDNPWFGLIDEETLWQQDRIASQALLDLITLAKQKPLGLMDFDALESAALQRLQHNPPPAPGLFIVDEFQDTSPRQLQILKALSGPKTEIFLVGDPKQSIYRFRKADVTLFAQQKKLLNHQLLSTNYRSEKSLLQFLNSAQNILFAEQDDLNPQPQALLAAKEDSDATASVHFSYYDQKNSLYKSVLTDLKNHRAKEAHQAVLFSKWKELYKFAEFLQSQNQPYAIAGSESVLDHPLTLLLAEAFESAENPDQLMGFYGMAQWKQEPWTLSNAEVMAFRESLLKIPGFQFEAQVVFLSFCQALEPSRWWRGSHWIIAMERLIRSLGDQGQLWQWDLQNWASFIREHAAREASLNLEKSQNSALQLYTVHGSKGLEFDGVYLFDLYQGPRGAGGRDLEGDDDGVAFNMRLFKKSGDVTTAPSFLYQKRVAARAEDAEQRRLLYVALTRGKKFLHVYVPQKIPEIKFRDNMHLLGWGPLKSSPWASLLQQTLEDPLVQDLWHQGKLSVHEYKGENSEPVETTEIVENKDPEFWLLPGDRRKFPQKIPYFDGGVTSYLNQELQNFKNESSVPAKKAMLKAAETQILGTRLHAILERWNGNFNYLDNLMEAQDQRFLPCLKNLRSLDGLKEFWQDAENNPERIYRELPIYHMLPNARLLGILDVLWVPSPGTAVIIDWKTTQSLNSLKKKERLEKIEQQLAIYAKALESTLPNISKIAVGIDLINDEVEMFKLN